MISEHGPVGSGQQTVQNQVLKAFPASNESRDSIYELAVTVWPHSNADKLKNVAVWTDLIDLDVADIGTRGIGILLHFIMPRVKTRSFRAGMKAVFSA